MANNWREYMQKAMDGIKIEEAVQNPKIKNLKKESQKITADSSLKLRDLKMKLQKFDNTLGGTTLFDEAEMKLDEAIGIIQQAYSEISMALTEAEHVEEYKK